MHNVMLGSDIFFSHTLFCKAKDSVGISRGARSDTWFFSINFFAISRGKEKK